ncbi:MAG: hypothetical protein IJ877_08485 [Candidatus Gastranaerophilales bacterium]|nr:hypothetical protein [Candidatus Gastranaerophilales bacterium]
MSKKTCYSLFMASNFDFLENIDKELYLNIEEAQKLFRDEYFNQSMVQIRIFAEKMSKKILNSPDNLTFDDTLNCLKDKIKTDKEQEFIEDLFFIKREGNKCAHGEDVSAITVLEAIKRAYEASINYASAKTKSSKFNKLNFDDTLLITTKPRSENTIVEQYVKLAQEKKEELLNSKQSEFSAKVEKKEDEAVKIKKTISPEKQRIKDKIKKAKKNLKQNVNKTTKPKKPKKQDNKRLYKLIAFILFVTISLFFLTKMIFLF